MKTESLRKYIEPRPRQVRNFCSTVTDSIPLPHKDLIQFWIDKPIVLARRLREINYRPALISKLNWNGLTSTFGLAIDRLLQDGLVLINDEDLSEDLVFLNGLTRANANIAHALSENGVAVVISVIDEDVKKLRDLKNIYAFTGNHCDVDETECFIRDVLFRLRARLYCGCTHDLV